MRRCDLKPSRNFGRDNHFPLGRGGESYRAEACDDGNSMKIVFQVVVDCPACGKLMRLANVVPAFAGHAEIRSYKCDSCGEVRATEVEVGTLRERPIFVAEAEVTTSFG